MATQKQKSNKLTERNIGEKRLDKTEKRRHSAKISYSRDGGPIKTKEY